MFWKKKKSPIPKQALALKAYLSVSMLMLSEKLTITVARTGLQVFILGMTDMLRQAESLSMEQFVTIYESTLSEYKLLPSMPVRSFINKVGEIASSNTDVAKVMRMGAQSMQMYVVERDANAPSDLFGAVIFAEKNPSGFTELNSSA
jgi:hypothetical protein